MNKVNNIETALTNIPFRTIITSCPKWDSYQGDRMNNTMKEQLEEINQLHKELTEIYRGIVSRYGISENEFWIWYTLIVMEDDYSQQDSWARQLHNIVAF